MVTDHPFFLKNCMPDRAGHDICLVPEASRRAGQWGNVCYHLWFDATYQLYNFYGKMGKTLVV